MLFFNFLCDNPTGGFIPLIAEHCLRLLYLCLLSKHDTF